MSFVVDSAEWSFDGWSSDKANEILEAFLARIETATARKEQVWIGDDLQSRSVHGELDLWSLRASDSPLQISPKYGRNLQHGYREQSAILMNQIGQTGSRTSTLPLMRMNQEHVRIGLGRITTYGPGSQSAV